MLLALLVFALAVFFCLALGDFQGLARLDVVALEVVGLFEVLDGDVVALGDGVEVVAGFDGVLGCFAALLSPVDVFLGLFVGAFCGLFAALV